MSGAVAEQPAQYAAEAREDESIVLFDVPWSTYVMLRDTLDESRPSVRLTYLEGMLEIMSPSPAHELDKKIIARLLEAYAEERDLRFDGQGSTTFRNELVARGAEPDECYSVRAAAPGDTPDIALEVVRAHWKVDKLAVYRGLGVPEVWVFRRGRFDVHVLGGEGYVLAERSERLPELDLARLATYVRHGEDQTQLVKAWRAELREAQRS